MECPGACGYFQQVMTISRKIPDSLLDKRIAQEIQLKVAASRIMEVNTFLEVHHSIRLDCGGLPQSLMITTKP